MRKVHLTGRGNNVAARGAIARFGCVAGTSLNLAVLQWGLAGSCRVTVRRVKARFRAVSRCHGAEWPTQRARFAQIGAVRAQEWAVGLCVWPLQTQSCEGLTAPF